MRSLITVLLIIVSVNVIAQVRTLEDYIRTGKQNNALQKDYYNQLLALGYDSLKISGTYNPQVNFIGQASYAPVIGGIGYDTVITNYGSVSALVSVSQFLFQGGKKDLELQKLHLQNQTISNTLQISDYDLQRNITAQYIVAYTDQSLLESNAQTLQLLSDQDQILRAFVKQGIYSQAEYLNLLLTRQQQEIATKQLRIQYRTDLYKLNQICYIVDTALVTLAAPTLAADIPVSEINSLFQRQFHYDSLSVEINRSLLDKNYDLKLGWSVDAGLNTSQPRYAYSNLGFSAGVNLTFPIYDGNQREYEYHKFDLARNTISYYAQTMRAERSSQKIMLAEQMRMSDSVISQYRQQIGSIENLIKYHRQQLGQGNMKMTDFLLAFNSLIAARTNLTQAEITRWQIINQLQYLNH